MLSKAATAPARAVPVGCLSGLSPVRALGLRRAAATVLVLVALVVMLLPTSTAHAASTCHGLPATIEASTGAVTGTAGDDVIVVTGTVTRVEAGDGNDLICLVDTRELPGFNIYIFVDPGAGDDVVDASAAGARTSASLGPGADSFTGSPFADQVSAGTGPPEGSPVEDPGPYQVATGPGRDYLQVRPGAIVHAHLGTGADGVIFSSSYAGPDSEFDLGAGRDGAHFEDYFDDPGAGDTSLLVDLAGDLVTWHDVTSTLRNAENIWGAARRVVILGDRGQNQLSGHGCHVMLKGGRGDDRLSLSSAKQDVAPVLENCSQTPHLRAYGNAGDDHLFGGRLHDVLIGGAGLDSAFGGSSGDDRCDAERTRGRGCER